MLEQKKFPEAVKCFDRIPTSHPRYGRMARYREGVLLIALFRAVEAERHLREVISLEEATPSIKSEFLIHARQRLRHILEVEVRFEERHHLLRGVIDRNEDQSFEPVAGCFPSLLSWNGPDAVLWIEHFQPAWTGIVSRYRPGWPPMAKKNYLLECSAQIRMNRIGILCDAQTFRFGRPW